MATVFLVDDEKILRTLLRFALERRGHRVIEACGARQAISFSIRHQDTIDLLVAAVALPGKSGLSLSHAIGADRPSMRTLLISRVPHAEELLAEARASGNPILAEPFEIGELLDGIDAALTSRRRRPPARSAQTRRAARKTSQGR